MHSQKLRKLYCQTKTRSICRFSLTMRFGTLSTARNLFARKLVFQANLQIRSVVFDVCQKKKNFSKEIKKYFGQVRLGQVRLGQVRLGQVILIISFTCMADKKRDILEFFEQSNFEQFTPTLRFQAISSHLKFNQTNSFATTKGM